MSKQRPGFGARLVTALAAVAISSVWLGTVWGNDAPIRELSSGKRVAVIGASTGLAVLAKVLPARESDTSRYLGYRANSLDRWWRSTIHGGTGRKTNFLDNSAGSLVTPAIGALTLSCIDINRPEFSRDIPFFLAGAATTGAITDITKLLIHRPRPYCQQGGVLPPDRAASAGYHTESFFSGHTSQAFFTAGFMNNRLRRHMRQEWSSGEYRSWRWASPAITFGWASLVGLSRIQADKHHFTDVLSGAAVGYAVSELYYRLCYDSGESSAPTIGETTHIISLKLSF